MSIPTDLTIPRMDLPLWHSGNALVRSNIIAATIETSRRLTPRKTQHATIIHYPPKKTNELTAILNLCK